MNIEKLINVIGVLGVIASLIFVGLELRQSQRIALGVAAQARLDALAAPRLAVLQTAPNAFKAPSGNISFEEYEVLTDDEKVIWELRSSTGALNLQNAWILFDESLSRGFLPLLCSCSAILRPQAPRRQVHALAGRRPRRLLRPLRTPRGRQPPPPVSSVFWHSSKACDKLRRVPKALPMRRGSYEDGACVGKRLGIGSGPMGCG